MQSSRVRPSQLDYRFYYRHSKPVLRGDDFGEMSDYTLAIEVLEVSDINLFTALRSKQREKATFMNGSLSKAFIEI